MTINLNKAQLLLIELQSARPTCDECETFSHADVQSGKVKLVPGPRWRKLELAYAYTRRCDDCMAPMYPWAKHLTAQQVLDWLLANPRVPIDVDKLRRDTLDRGGFSFL